MRDSSLALIVLLMGAISRSIVESNVRGMFAFLALVAMHESYRAKRGILGPTNLALVMIWIMRPELYIAWVVFWEIGLCEKTEKKTLIGKNGQKKVVEHKKSILGPISEWQIWDALAALELNLIGNNLEIEYIGNIDPTQPIMEENHVMQTLTTVEAEMKDTYDYTKYILVAAVIAVAAAIGGTPGMGIGAAVAVCIIRSNPEAKVRDRKIDAIEVSKSEKLGVSDGIYRIQTRIFDIPKHRGIGYVKNGVLHSRYHVTEGCAIEIDEAIHRPTYINKTKDNISYGGLPQIARVATREEIVVALAGPGTNYIFPYKTRAETDDSGNLIFYGNRSIPGCSGSPIFRITNTTLRNAEGNEVVTTDYVLVGTIGWFFDKKVSDGDNGGSDERKAVEIAPSDPHISEYHVRYVPNSITQIFKHPGAGKTRTIAKDLIIDGMNMYGKVYFTGPTRVVCEEAYNALKDIFPDKVALCTSSATSVERGSGMRPIMIMAHATALSMLARGSSSVMKKGLWILDEAHFMDPKTFVLKDYLRHKVSKEHSGSLVEMTATGFDIQKGVYVIADGSNSPIQDVTMSNNDMAEGIVKDSLDKKVLVFVSAMKGKDISTATTLATKVQAAGANYIMLSRETFESSYKKAKELKRGAIFTTDISECGANIHPDIVYDFQISSKVMAIGTSAVLEKRVIDEGQRTQRRGRVGRDPTPDYPAVYVSPGYALPKTDFGRIEHHERYAAAKALGIEIKDPTVSAPSLEDISLTADQIAVWAASGVGGLNSLRAIHMTTGPRGLSLPPEELQHRINEWAESDSSMLRDGNRYTMCAWFDYRDRHLLIKMAEKLGKIPPSDNIKSSPESIVTTINKILGRSVRPVINHLGIVNHTNICDDDPNETVNKTEDDKEEDDDYHSKTQ